MKLYRGPDPTVWIGEDAAGGLVMWPREPGGWARRTVYTGQRRILEEVAPALARGTRWPGAGRSRKPRSESGEASNRRITLRATDAEADAWEERAGAEGKGVTVWARDTLNTEVARPRSKK